MRRKFGLYVTFALALTYGLGSWALIVGAEQDSKELRSTLEDQQSVAVTIYNRDLALIKDRRQVELPAGESLLALREVSGGMMAETALLRQLGGKGRLRVVEQSFDYDLLTPQKLLEKYVGKTVQVVRVHPQSGAETLEAATVLAANGGVVLRMGDRIETGVPGRLVYPDVPANLRDRPTLVVQLASDKAGPKELELSYLTSGLSWKADYVAELSADDDFIDLSGWVTLNNRSGSSYRNARLQLVAGDVHRVPPVVLERAAFEDRMVKTMAAAPAMVEESLLDYHLYTLERPTTIRQNQVKQVALLTASSIPVRKEYLIHGSEYYYRGLYGKLGEKIKASVFLEFDNRRENSLGMPLPKGILRVYKNDKAGNAQFVGEDSIDHTGKNQTVRLRLGAAFDVTAERTQTDFKKLASGRRENLVESAYLVELNNGSDKPVTVKLAEPLPGDWEIIDESLPHKKQDARTAVWQVEVPAEGKVLLTYRARVRY
ncbi:hypothetical protein A7E78_11760 [Syntrophotalea acetylenivorans]|uniref:DUF4139 domain-containing protein n=1 Tax=Syntrophotalea acetylenivorans TaxID=1842532 RepID=A0A1L3GT68_9BACT|nr:DUF4139 domain-containing protein [Syntrophotalea acetylenivorans]APG29122.1 hypothetical protein A7E78_11760 [Syntrophotalea acetylenivorans]